MWKVSRWKEYTDNRNRCTHSGARVVLTAKRGRGCEKKWKPSRWGLSTPGALFRCCWCDRCRHHVLPIRTACTMCARERGKYETLSNWVITESQWTQWHKPFAYFSFWGSTIWTVFLSKLYFFLRSTIFNWTIVSFDTLHEECNTVSMLLGIMFSCIYLPNSG